jgi:AhpD family alkylhydroperoxidase
MYDMDQIKKLPRLGAHASDAWKGFLAFDQAALADGAIPKKYKELIALAVALTTQCPYCLEIHKSNALKAGATERLESRRDCGACAGAGCQEARPI